MASFGISIQFKVTLNKYIKGFFFLVYYQLLENL